MRVIVCGGRDYNHREELFGTLNELHRVKPIDCLIHGGARGADYLAGQWAKQHNGVTVVVVPAEWGKHGKAAGPKRNQEMVTQYNPDMVIGFRGGAGTADCCRRAEEAGIKVIRVKQQET